MRCRLGWPRFGKIGGEATRIVANGHLVVVQDYQHVGPHMTCMGERFKGHSARNGAVTYDSHDLAIQPLPTGRYSHAHGGRNAGGAVTDTKGIEWAFASLGETGEATCLPYGGQSVHAPRQYFVRVGLVPHVPDDPVLGGIEHVMKCD